MGASAIPGSPLKQHGLDGLTESAAPFGNTLWQAFKQQCAADGNILPLLITQSEPKDARLACSSDIGRAGPRAVIRSGISRLLSASRQKLAIRFHTPHPQNPPLIFAYLGRDGYLIGQ